MKEFIYLTPAKDNSLRNVDLDVLPSKNFAIDHICLGLHSNFLQPLLFLPHGGKDVVARYSGEVFSKNFSHLNQFSLQLFTHFATSFNLEF